MSSPTSDTEALREGLYKIFYDLGVPSANSGMEKPYVIDAADQILEIIQESNRQAEIQAIKKLVNELQMDMRLEFDADKLDFGTFDAMLGFMNGWVADEFKALNSKEKEQSDGRQ